MVNSIGARVTQSRRTLLLSAASLLTSPLQSLAQTPTFSAETRVVNLLVTVWDQNGRLRTDLTQNDFIIEEDGLRQDIQYFATQSDLPLTLGLLIDSSRSLISQLHREREAADKFFHQVLRAADRAFVVLFASRVVLLQTLTSSLELLDSALAQVDRQSAALQSVTNPYNTSLFDAVATASIDVLEKQTGRRALIVFSDGLDNNSEVYLTGAIAAAQRAEASVFCIHLFGPNIPQLIEGRAHEAAREYAQRDEMLRQREAGKFVLSQISQETGGTLYEGSSGKFQAIFAQIENELRSQFSIGYTRKPPTSIPGFHSIAVSTKDKRLRVQTRSGYYLPKP